MDRGTLLYVVYILGVLPILLVFLVYLLLDLRIYGLLRRAGTYMWDGARRL